MKKLLLIAPEGPLLTEFTQRLDKDFEIVTAYDEKTGFEILDINYDKIAGILLDADLARKSDFHLIRMMEQDKIFASIPVIAILDHTPSPDDIDVYEKGCTEILSPPGFRELLVHRINNAIRAKDSFTYSEMQKMLKQLPSNIYLKDKDGNYVFATQYWHHLRKEGERHWTIRGKSDIDIRKDKQNAMKAMETDRMMLETGQGTQYVIEENEDGIQEFLELIKRPVYDDEGNIIGIIALINDVTEKELLKMELEKRSRTDQLTGLLNKGAVEDLIKMILTTSANKGKTSALLVIDTDDFKNVNDTFGHIAGDRVLATIGRIINTSFKGNDVAGRIGGDEFMVLLRDIDSKETAGKIAERLQHEVLNAFSNDLKECVSLSIGIAITPDHGTDFNELYKAADNAMYYVKNHGKASYHIYSNEPL